MQGEQKKKKKVIIGAVAAALVLLLGTGAYMLFKSAGGCRDYTIRTEQYFVEYSEKYDYWDVITVEYPSLSGIGREQEDAVNQIFYDTAMDKVNYWHLFPDDEVKELQKEYQIYCSDVRCSIDFHSQYLVSAVFYESYAPVSPVWYVHKTRRSANVNLMTGEVYELSDILQINDDFMEFWCQRAGQNHTNVIFDDPDTRDTFLQWFLGEDEELKELYMFRPFFYMTEDGNFVVGLAIDPTVRTVLNNLELDSSYWALFSAQELELWRTESEFWKLYERSQKAGEVHPCENLQENIWMREDSGVWDFMER